MKRYFLSLLGLLVAACGLFYVLFLRLEQSDLDAVYEKMRQEQYASLVPQITPPPQEVVVTPEPTPVPTPEPEPEYFTLSVIGDLTLANRPNSNDFMNKVKDNLSYNFENTREYFVDDEFTIANLECTFSDRNLAYDYTHLFYFKSPSSYANILLDGGIDFVTTANNHTDDYYQKGQDDTYSALQDIGMPYGVEQQSQIIVSDNGIKFGIYCSGNDMRPDLHKAAALEGIAQLKKDGADYIICAFHWGIEMYYTPHENNQVAFAKECIDAGADLIYGSHTHCLEPVEEYNGGIILYSMGNFSFGGSDMPSDPDTAIVQITLKRDIDGTVSSDGISYIPCCVSSTPPANIDNPKAYAYNDYKPTPYEEGSEDYYRVLSKLDGTYEPDKQGADYSSYYASLGAND